MTSELSPVPVSGSRVRVCRSAEEWAGIVADHERWDGTQVSFCASRGISVQSLQYWRRKLGFTPGSGSTGSCGFVELSAAPEPAWDVELSLGEGVVLRLRRG